MRFYNAKLWVYYEGKKKRFIKMVQKKGRECEGGIVLNGGKYKLLWQGKKHTLHLIYKRNIFFSFSFSFYI